MADDMSVLINDVSDIAAVVNAIVITRAKNSRAQTESFSSFCIKRN